MESHSILYRDKYPRDTLLFDSKVQKRAASTGFSLEHETRNDMASSWSRTGSQTSRRCEVGGTRREVIATSQAPVNQIPPPNFVLEFVNCGNSSDKVGYLLSVIHQSNRGSPGTFMLAVLVEIAGVFAER